MKKTLSMLLALCMVVALVAIPVSAETELVKVPFFFDLDSLEVGTVLTSEDLADDPVLKYVGTNPYSATNVTYTTADGTQATLTDYNKLKFDPAASTKADDSWSGVVVTELDGEKVLAVQAKQGLAGLAFQPAGEALANGETVQVSFEFNQPKANFMTGNILGLAVDNGEGLNWLEVSEPTDTSWDLVRSGSNHTTRFINGGSNDVGAYLNLTFNQFDVLSPAIFYTRTTAAGEYSGTNAWSMGRAKNASNAQYGDDADSRKAAMGQWYKVTYQMTKKDAGIWVRIYSNDVAATSLNYTEYLYPLSPAELETLDISKITPVLTGLNNTTSDARMYVRNISNFGTVEANAPVYETKNYEDITFEEMAIGTAPRDDKIWVGVGSRQNILWPNSDDVIDEDNNVQVAYNPATTQGNPSGKVLAINRKANSTETTWWGFRTKPFLGSEMQGPGGVTFETDYYAPVDFGNGRFFLNKCWQDTGVSIDGAYSHGDKSRGLYVIGHYQRNGISMAGSDGAITWGTNLPASQNWIRHYVNYQADEAGHITCTWYAKNLATGDVTSEKTMTTTSTYVMSDYYNIVLTFNRFKADGSIYFDNMKVTHPVQNLDTKVYSAEDANSVYGSSTEFYVELPSAASDSAALANAVTVKDSADVEVAIEASAAVVDGVQVVTIVPVDGLADDEVYTVSFNGKTDSHLVAYPDVKFRAVADWNPYDPENPAEVTTDMAEELNIGDEFAVMVADGMNGEYTADMYEVTTSNANVVTVSKETGAWIATVTGVGEAELYVKNYIAPAEARKVIAVNCNAIATKHTVTFYNGEEIVAEVEVGDGWLVEAPEIELAEGQALAMWAIDAEGTEEADLTSVKNDMDVYAITADILDITFTTNDETLGTVNVETVGIAQGGSLDAVPAVTPAANAKLVAWEDAEGNRYTDAELLALTFDEETTITAIFAKTVIEIGYDYDFTTMTVEEAKDLTASGAITNLFGGSMVLDAEKGLSYTATTQLNAYVEPITEGIYVFEADYYFTKGCGGSNIEFKTSASADLQGVYPVGTIHVRQSDGAATTPRAITGFACANDDYNSLKFYMDFDNGKFYIVNNGISGVSHYGDNLLGDDLKRFGLYVTPNMHFQRIALKKVEALDLVNVSVTDTETANAMIGRDGVETATIVADTKIKLHAQPAATGNFGFEYNFDGWEVTGGTVEDATAPDTFLTITEEAATATATGSVNYITFKFAETEYVTITSGEDLAEQTFQWGNKPAGAPEFAVADGYLLQGFAKLYDDGSLGAPIPLETIVGSRADSSATWVPVVKKIVNINISSAGAAAQKGEIVEVPFKVALDVEAVNGVFTVEYDAAALEYVGADISEAFETEVYAKKLEDGKVQIIIRTDDSVTFTGEVAVLKFKALAVGTTNINVVDSLQLKPSELEYAVMSSYDFGDIEISALKGDVNLDGKINVYDAIAVLTHVAETVILDDAGLEAADVDGVDGVTVADATQILKYIARLIANF